MGSAITQDVPPYVMVGGRPTRPHGINSVGMERSGSSPEAARLIRKAYKIKDPTSNLTVVCLFRV
jgi:UDP-N-acetylglucosamine acyltransferase